MRALLSAVQNSSIAAPALLPGQQIKLPRRSTDRQIGSQRDDSRGDSQSGLTVRAEPSPRGQVMAYLPVGSTITYSGEASNGWIGYLHQ